jgi:glycosyltransferase involved in cell wall biosynthesis
LGASAHIIWRGEVARNELLAIYSGHHAFLFPSLHDASGTVIIEAWANSLPVICLALGGPGEMVDQSCGRVVSVTNLSEEQCVAALGAEIVALARDEQARLELCRGAMIRAREHTWPKVVARLYVKIADTLRMSGEQINPSRSEAPQQQVWTA